MRPTSDRALAGEATLGVHTGSAEGKHARSGGSRGAKAFGMKAHFPNLAFPHSIIIIKSSPSYPSGHTGVSDLRGCLTLALMRSEGFGF